MPQTIASQTHASMEVALTLDPTLNAPVTVVGKARTAALMLTTVSNMNVANSGSVTTMEPTPISAGVVPDGKGGFVIFQRVARS